MGAGSQAVGPTESAGRRESLMELLRDHQIDLPSVDSLQAFVDSGHRHAITAARNRSLSRAWASRRHSRSLIA